MGGSETGETIRSEEEHQGVVATTGEPPAIEGGNCNGQSAEWGCQSVAGPRTCDV